MGKEHLTGTFAEVESASQKQLSSACNSVLRIYLRQSQGHQNKKGFIWVKEYFQKFVCAKDA